MLLKILKKDMFRKKVMNFILFLFILLATLFVATGISNVVTVLNGTNYYFDRAGIGDYVVLVQGEDAVRELDHYLKTQASIKSFRYENGFSTNREHVFVNGKEAYTVEFRVGFVEYEYVIDSANSAVISTVVND